MTNSTQEYLVRRKAFAEEFEKLGGYALVGRLIAGLMSKSTLAKNLVGKVSRFGSKYSTRSLNKPMYLTAKGGGKTFHFGMDALGKSTLKPWLGKGRAPIGVRQVNKVKFTKDPVRSIGQSVLRGAANTVEDLKTIAKKGPWSYMKKDIARAQTFSKTVTGKGGKQYEIFGKRSLSGKILNPVAETGLGIGGLTLAMNGRDEQGKKRGLLSRVGSAAKDTFVWGPMRAPAAAFYGATELPKITKDIIKGF